MNDFVKKLWVGFRDYAGARLKEKSTYVGLVGLVASFGVWQFAPEQSAAIANALYALADLQFNPGDAEAVGAGISAVLVVLKTKKPDDAA
jgi:hypothetical protein